MKTIYELGHQVDNLSSLVNSLVDLEFGLFGTSSAVPPPQDKLGKPERKEGLVNQLEDQVTQLSTELIRAHRIVQGLRERLGFAEPAPGATPGEYDARPFR